MIVVITLISMWYIVKHASMPDRLHDAAQMLTAWVAARTESSSSGDLAAQAVDGRAS